jgi:hypothetical protein
MSLLSNSSEEAKKYFKLFLENGNIIFSHAYVSNQNGDIKSNFASDELLNDGE